MILDDLDRELLSRIAAESELTQVQLAKLVGVPAKTVRVRLRHLEDDGHLQRRIRGLRGGGRSVEYLLPETKRQAAETKRPSVGSRNGTNETAGQRRNGHETAMAGDETAGETAIGPVEYPGYPHGPVYGMWEQNGVLRPPHADPRRFLPR